MGTDCYVVVDDRINHLDRWYIFSQKLRNNKYCSKRKVLRCLRILENHLAGNHGFGDDHARYCRIWYRKVRDIIKKSEYSSKIIFYADYDLPDYLYGPGFYDLVVT